jgi:hypothetical protein
VASQEFEQHCWSLLQATPAVVQLEPVPPLPPEPVLITLAFPLPQPASPTAIEAIANVR